MSMFNAALLSPDRVDSFRKGGCLESRSLTYKWHHFFYVGHVGELKVPWGRPWCKSHVMLTWMFCVRRWGETFALYRAFLIEGKDWWLNQPYRRHARILDCFIKGWYSTNWTSERRQRSISSTLPMSLWQILQNCRDETAYSTTWQYEKASRTRTTLSRCWTPASPTGEPGVAVRRARPRQTWSRCRQVIGTAWSRQHARTLSDNVHLHFHFQHNKIIIIRPSQLTAHNQQNMHPWIIDIWCRFALCGYMLHFPSRAM